MGKLMKGGISYGGVAEVDVSNEPVILTVTEMPNNPRNGMTVMYEGPDAADFLNGHMYQYSQADGEWVEMKVVTPIPLSEIQSLFE